MEWKQPKRIRFKFAPEKAKEAIIWMLQQKNNLDLHTLLKACYFGDKAHLNKYTRPIFGATYRAMKFGPVPLEIYEMLKCEPIWLAELSLDDFPWDLDGFKLSIGQNTQSDGRVFSNTDTECLREGFYKSIALSFDGRTAATHGEDWQKADLGIMRYEDMLVASFDKEQKIAYLRESGPFMRL